MLASHLPAVNPGKPGPINFSGLSRVAWSYSSEKRESTAGYQNLSLPGQSESREMPTSTQTPLRVWCGCKRRAVAGWSGWNP